MRGYLEVSIIIRKFAHKIQDVMKESKPYPHIDEEDGSTFKASEPVAVASCASPSTDDVANVHDRIDDLDWEHFPSFGPFSDEEAIARIERAEKDLNDPSKWITAEEMDRRLYEKFPWLR